MASNDYPRMMFHRHKDPVTIHSREQEDALGREWSRIIWPAEAPEPALFTRAEQVIPRPPVRHPKPEPKPEREPEPEPEPNEEALPVRRPVKPPPTRGQATKPAKKKH